MRDFYLERESRLPVGLAAAAAAILLLLASASDVRAADPDMQPSATLAIERGGRAFLGDAPRGALSFRGRHYGFAIAGIGFGGTGDADPGARGRVYNLRSASDFPGDYMALKSGPARASGRLWLKNRDGVVLELEPASDMTAIALGPGTVTITYR